MSNGNGNGKVDQRIVEAQRRLHKAQEPLKELDAKLAALQQQCTQTQTALEAADAEHTRAGRDFANDDSATNRRRLLTAAEESRVQQAKLKVLNDRIASLQAQRAPLDATVQQASTVLSEATNEVRLQALEQELATHKYHIAQHETAIRERTKLYNAAEAEYKQLLRGPDDWPVKQRGINEKFRRVNGPTPGFESVRRGF